MISGALPITCNKKRKGKNIKMNIYAGSDKWGSVVSDAEKLAKPITRATCACVMNI